MGEGPVPADASSGRYGAGNQAQAQSSGSFWMPLMAGYMMGRLMGGGAGYQQQPLFSSKNPASPAYGQYTDAAAKANGAATPGRTVTVPKTAMAPKPATTNTITRGGLVSLWRNRPACSAVRQAPLVAQWAADHGTSQYYRTPGLARKSDRVRFNFHTMYGEPYWCKMLTTSSRSLRWKSLKT